MMTWYMTPSTNLMIDVETEEIRTVSENYTSIQYCYIAPCDCVLKYKDSNSSEFITKEVKQGQIILTFYSSKMPHKFLVIDSEEFKDNLVAYNEEI